MSIRRGSVGSSSNKLQLPSVKPRSNSDSSQLPTRQPLSDLSNQLQPSRSHRGFLGSLLAGDLDNCHPDAKPFIKDYKTTKEQLTKLLYKFYNEKVFKNVLPADLEVTWNNRLTKTAGNCYYQEDSSGRHQCFIHLSVKVLDSPNRLLRTLVHEMCHAATWIVDKLSDAHGPVWQAWTEKAMDALPELPKITTCHDYEIKCRYTYKCTKCKDEIGRHSKSIDVKEMVCGSSKPNGVSCRGKFDLIVNKGFTPDNKKKSARKNSSNLLDDLESRFSRVRI